jgi:hypothetical protein
MAWESQISFNAEVADATREALEKKDAQWLATAIANDRYVRIFGGATWNERNQKAFDRWVYQGSQLSHDVLVNECMRRAERTDTADNGGGVIWIDANGHSRVELD